MTGRGAVPYTSDMEAEKHVSSTDLDRRPGEVLLDVVISGEPVIVTRHGTPIVRMTPIKRGDSTAHRPTGERGAEEEA